jgi:polysaccharide biosynthesis/export protein
MAVTGQAMRLAAHWAVGVCLLSLGCQAQVSYTILGGPKKPANKEAVSDDEARLTPEAQPGTGGPTSSAGPDIIRAAYLPASVPAAGQPAPMPPGAPAQGAGPGSAIIASGPTGGSIVMPGSSGLMAPSPDGTGMPGAPGCGPGPNGEQQPIPRELAKVSLPPYMIEPPDILLINAVRLTPRPPYRLEPQDVLQVVVAETLPNQPIAGLYTIAPDGTINLGFAYGVVRIGGMTAEQAQAAIAQHLGQVLRNPQVAVTLVQIRAVMQTQGEHLVRPDGTISLGTYGAVYVTGLTLAQAKCAIERHLAQFLANPEISIDVYAYNSKVYYVITDGAGFGEQVYRFAVTGNETVLDAIGQIYGLPAVASKRKIWLARPSPPGYPCDQVLPVDWKAITQGGSTDTNYQVFPGDRIYVKSDCLIWLDNTMAKIIAPIERLFGITLLGSETVRSFGRNGAGTNGAFITTF